jgi:hypothetical protein
MDAIATSGNIFNVAVLIVIGIGIVTTIGIVVREQVENDDAQPPK